MKITKKVIQQARIAAWAGTLTTFLVEFLLIKYISKWFLQPISNEINILMILTYEMITSQVIEQRNNILSKALNENLKELAEETKEEKI